MRKTLLDLLVDPIDRQPLRLEVETESDGGEIVQGILRARDGRAYPVVNGIPRLVLDEDGDQRQTSGSFAFKWRQRETYESPEFLATARRWLVDRYGFSDVNDMRRYFGTRGCILDAGCGSGFSTSLWMDESFGRALWFGADISEAVDVAQDRLKNIPNTTFLQASVLSLPFRDETFDTIFSEGVLHHTPSTEAALKALARLLEPGGEILFYVYRKKGPIREFSDDYIRSVVSSLDAEAAWEALRSLTRLGHALAGLHVQVDVPEDVPYLGIKAGRNDVQRLIYLHFVKLFWNEAFSFEENVHVNFDWYHPRYAHRQTDDEVRRWCAEAALRITRFDVQESGFTVRALKS